MEYTRSPLNFNITIDCIVMIKPYVNDKSLSLLEYTLGTWSIQFQAVGK
jgi:hypothetical protein